MENERLITVEYVNTIIKERPEEIHKGQCGRVLIIAGSVGMAGAAVLAARGSVKSGAGLVKIAAPLEIFCILQSAVPQATCMDLSEITSRDISKVFPQGQPHIYGAVAIGPGMGVDENKYLLIKDILSHYNGTVVLDADAINTLCRYDKGLDALKAKRASVILTPHVGEGDRLLAALGFDKGDVSVGKIGRKEAAELISRETASTVVMKGPATVVSYLSDVTEADIQTYINTTGNPGMATGGSGDVLTGVIASLAAYGLKPADAAKTGVFMHGLAGDIAAAQHGRWGMTAVEIESSLPAAFKEVVGK